MREIYYIWRVGSEGNLKSHSVAKPGESERGRIWVRGKDQWCRYREDLNLSCSYTACASAQCRNQSLLCLRRQHNSIVWYTPERFGIGSFHRWATLDDSVKLNGTNLRPNDDESQASLMIYMLYTQRFAEIYISKMSFFIYYYSLYSSSNKPTSLRYKKHWKIFLLKKVYKHFLYFGCFNFFLID